MRKRRNARGLPLFSYKPTSRSKPGTHIQNWNFHSNLTIFDDISKIFVLEFDFMTANWLRSADDRFDQLAATRLSFQMLIQQLA